MAALPQLTPHQLNRAVLARQLLLERASLTIPEALQRIGGLQTQYAPSGYVGLWTRLLGFERSALTDALADRTVVQGTLMRVTIHMVAAEDYWPMVIGIRASRQEWWRRIARSRRLGDIDHDAIATTLRGLLDEGPRSAAELISGLEDAGFAKPLWEGAGLWVDMVRVPPSGTWERRRADRYALAEKWVGPPPDISEADGLRLLLDRYLTAFGPASINDAAAWMGVSKQRLEPVAAAMELRRSVTEDGLTLLDVPDAVLPHESTAAPVRFLPTWDATLLVHCRRSGVLPEPLRPQIFHNKNPSSVGTVLVDGHVAATWAWRRDHVEVTPLRTLSKSEQRQVDAEAEALAVFHRE